MQLRSLNRYQAFAWHFLFSLILGIAVFALFRFVWYPDALFTLADAGKLLLLVVGIDVVMGPLLTLIVFNPVKKSLPFDLAVIVALQLGALGYGVWVMAQSRPVFLVGINNNFELVFANEIHPDDLAMASSDEFKHLSWTGPKLIGAVAPGDSEARISITMDAINGGPDVHRLPKYYVAYEQVAAKLVARGKPLEHFANADPHQLKWIDRELNRRSLSTTDVTLLPLKARKGIGAVVVNRGTTLPLFSVAIDGFD